MKKRKLLIACLIMQVLAIMLEYVEIPIFPRLWMVGMLFETITAILYIVYLFLSADDMLDIKKYLLILHSPILLLNATCIVTWGTVIFRIISIICISIHIALSLLVLICKENPNRLISIYDKDWFILSFKITIILIIIRIVLGIAWFMAGGFFLYYVPLMMLMMLYILNIARFIYKYKQLKIIYKK